MKEFLYAQNGLAIYEALSFDVQRKGVPTLHLFSTEVSARFLFFSNSFFGLWSRLRALLTLLRHSFSPCSHAQNSEESYHRIVLADFSFDELHLLMSKLGLEKKPGKQSFCATETCISLSPSDTSSSSILL